MAFLIPICFGVVFALVFEFVSTRKFNLITRIASDILLGLIPPISVYIVLFFVCNGIVAHYCIPLFLLAFFITLSFFEPRKRKTL